MDSFWPGWIEAGAAALSVIGAAFAWWRSNLSKRARDEARSAEENADQHLTAAQRAAEATAASAAEVRRIADQIEGPPLIAAEIGEYSWALQNTRNREIEIASVLNRAAFQSLDGLPDEFTIPPYGSLWFGAFGRRPVELVLEPRDDASPHALHVALRPRH